jgi:hypothetical protein
MQKEMFSTINLKVATALLTLGFKKITLTTIRQHDGKESRVFWFEGTNSRGDKAETISHLFTRGVEQLKANDPEGVLYHLYAYAHNRDELIKDVYAAPRMVEIVTPEGRRLMIAENASEETRQKVAAMI